LGFGSFQFQATEFAPEEFKESEFLTFVEAGLKAIEGVSNVKVKRDKRGRRDAQLRKPEVVPLYAEDGEPFPYIEFANVDFDLHISRAAQEEMVDEKEILAIDLGEDFHVRVRDGWKLSSAMVWAPGAANRHVPPTPSPP